MAGRIEAEWIASPGRRRALVQLAAFLMGSPLLKASQELSPLLNHRRFPGLDEMMTTFDFEPIFRANVPLAVYDYTARGAESEFTAHRNREAFGLVDIVPRKGVAVTDVDTSTELFGHKMSFPILVSPTAAQGQIHPDGEKAMHMGAAGANTTMVVADGAGFPLEQIAAAAKGPLWAQHLPTQDMNRRRDGLGRAESVGCQAIMVTVDGRSLGDLFVREIHDRNLGAVPRTGARRAPRGTPWNSYRVTDTLTGPWVGWQYMGEIRQLVKVPLLVKGILTVEDAQLAVEHGVDGIIVSNHGGRAQDYDPSTLEVLPEIVSAVGGKLTILIDSGFRRGEDVFKALALGAKGVLFGRATRWALGAFGPAGVQLTLEILQAELVATMKAAGRPTLASIDRTAVKTRFA